MSSEEIGLQILCSAWVRRLWTLREGLYQERVHYRFADAVQVYSHLDRTVRQRWLLPQRQGLVPNDHFFNQVLANLLNCLKDLEPLRAHAHKALSCWPRISSFFK